MDNKYIKILNLISPNVNIDQSYTWTPWHICQDDWSQEDTQRQGFSGIYTSKYSNTLLEQESCLGIKIPNSLIENLDSIPTSGPWLQLPANADLRGSEDGSDN